MNPTMSAAGDRYNFLWFVDADGAPTGKTRTQPSAGTSTNGGPLRLLMPKSVTPTNAPQPDVVSVTGEDGSVQHNYQFGSSTVQGMTVQIAAQDLATAMGIQNMPVNALAGGRYGYEWLADVQIPDMMYLAQSRSVRVADGAQKWSGKLWMRCSVSYQGRADFTEKGAAVFNYYLSPQPSAYEPWGYTIFDNDGNQKQASILPFDNYDYPLTIQAFTGNNSATAFPTDYQPVDTTRVTALTVSSTVGIRQPTTHSVSSVTTSAPFGITLGAAPGSGRRGILIYQFKG